MCIKPTDSVGVVLSLLINMNKLFVLDTNVLLHDPQAIFNFQEHDLVIPLQVIEELDAKKKAPGMLGYAARQAIRNIEDLRRVQPNLREGAPLGEGLGTLTVELLNKQSLSDFPLELHRALESVDNIIVALCKVLVNKYLGRPVILISKDANLRVKAGILGITAEDYRTDSVDVAHLYTGTDEIEVAKEAIDEAYRCKAVLVSNRTFYPNQCVTLINEYNPSHSVLTLADAEKPNLLHLIEDTPFTERYKKNREQQFALELLLNPNIDLVTISGKPGTGKTFIALVAALEALNRGAQHQVIIGRKHVHHGKEEGWTTGDIKQKTEPWMEPFYSNLEEILGDGDVEGLRSAGKSSKNGSAPMKPYEYLFLTNQFTTVHLSFIRGVTWNRKFVIIDEAENLTPEEAKTIICRAGHGTKIVMLGDIEQIDDPYLDASNNGLTYTIETHKDKAIVGHIHLVKNTRSRLAELAATTM